MKFVRKLLFAVGEDSRQLPWLIAQMTAVALLELLTIGGIPPLVSLLTRPEEAVNSAGVRTLYGMSGASSTEGFIWIFGFTLLVLFVLKAALSAATNYRQFKFSYRVQMALGKRMLQRLLAQGSENTLTPLRSRRQVPLETVQNGMHQKRLESQTVS